MPYQFAEKSIKNIVLDFDQTMYPNTVKLRSKQKRLIGRNLVINILTKDRIPLTTKNISGLESRYHQLAKKIGHSQAFIEIGGDSEDYFPIIKNTEQSPLLKPDIQLINMLQLMKDHANLFIFTGSYFGPVSRALNILLDGKAQNLIKQIIASDSLPHEKPSQEAYLEMTEALNIKPQESIMVDDRHVEIMAAQSIGMLGIIVGRLHSPEITSQANASIRTIHSLTKVLSLQ